MENSIVTILTIATCAIKFALFLAIFIKLSILKMNNPLEQLSKIYRENEYSSDILFTIQDVCGPVYTWPDYIRNVVRSRTFGYTERVKLTTFFWVNGYRNLDGWLMFLIRTKGPAFCRYEAELKTLFSYYNQEEIQKKYI